MNSAPIESVSSRLLTVPLPSYMHYFGYQVVHVPFVTIRDRDGAEATGFAYTLDGGAAMVCRMVDEVIAPQLVGADPNAWEAVRQSTLGTTRRLGATMFTAALSAVDIGIWDLRGIRAQRPLYELIGGQRKPVAIYGSGRSGKAMTTRELVDHSLGYLEGGYCGVKVAIGAHPPDGDLARVGAVREAIGPDVALMVDGSEQLTLDDALWLGWRLEDLGVRWFEEPLLAEDVVGYAMLAARLRVPVATGEHLQGSAAFARYLRDTDVSIYQPDAALGGGVTEMLAVSALATASNRSLAWHSLADLHIHLAVSAPMTRYVEDFPILSCLLEETLTPAKGLVVPSERPGHGMVWDVKKIAEYGGRQ